MINQDIKINVTAVVTCMTKPEHRYIREAILSIIEQTYSCQIVLYVSQSDHCIENVLGELAMHLNIRRVPLMPPGIVRNIGVAEASTEWIAFLDGDDIWTSQKLQVQLTHANINNCAVVGCRHILIREEGTPFFFGFAKEMPMPSSWLIKRDLLLKEPFTDSLTAEDVELWTRLKQQVEVSILKDYLIHYRVRQTSTSSSTFWKRRKYFFARLSRLSGASACLLILSRLWAFFV